MRAVVFAFVAFVVGVSVTFLGAFTWVADVGLVVTVTSVALLIGFVVRWLVITLSTRGAAPTRGQAPVGVGRGAHTKHPGRGR